MADVTVSEVLAQSNTKTPDFMAPVLLPNPPKPDNSQAERSAINRQQYLEDEVLAGRPPPGEEWPDEKYLATSELLERSVLPGGERDPLLNPGRPRTVDGEPVPVTDAEYMMREAGRFPNRQNPLALIGRAETLEKTATADMRDVTARGVYTPPEHAYENLSPVKKYLIGKSDRPELLDDPGGSVITAAETFDEEFGPQVIVEGTPAHEWMHAGLNAIRKADPDFELPKFPSKYAVNDEEMWVRLIHAHTEDLSAVPVTETLAIDERAQFDDDGFVRQEILKTKLQEDRYFINKTGEDTDYWLSQPSAIRGINSILEKANEVGRELGSFDVTETPSDRAQFAPGGQRRYEGTEISARQPFREGGMGITRTREHSSMPQEARREVPDPITISELVEGADEAVGDFVPGWGDYKTLEELKASLPDALRSYEGLERSGTLAAAAALGLVPGAGDYASKLLKRAAKKEPIKSAAEPSLNLTQKETDFFDEFLDSPADRYALQEEVPSLVVENGVLTVSPVDVDALEDWIMDGIIADGALSVPPRLRKGDVFNRFAGQVKEFAQGGIASLPKNPVLGGQEHMLAYITPEEASTLRAQGGGVTPDGGQYTGPGGIASFWGVSSATSGHAAAVGAAAAPGGAGHGQGLSPGQVPGIAGTTSSGQGIGGYGGHAPGGSGGTAVGMADAAAAMGLSSVSGPTGYGGVTGTVPGTKGYVSMFSPAHTSAYGDTNPNLVDLSAAAKAAAAESSDALAEAKAKEAEDRRKAGEDDTDPWSDSDRTKQDENAARRRAILSQAVEDGYVPNLQSLVNLAATLDHQPGDDGGFFGLIQGYKTPWGQTLSTPADVLGLGPKGYAKSASGMETIGDPNSPFGKAVLGLATPLMSLLAPQLTMPLMAMEKAYSIAHPNEQPLGIDFSGLANTAAEALGLGETPVGDVSEAVTGSRTPLSDVTGYIGDAAQSAAESLSLGNIFGPPTPSTATTPDVPGGPGLVPTPDPMQLQPLGVAPPIPTVTETLEDFQAPPDVNAAAQQLANATGATLDQALAYFASRYA